MTDQYWVLPISGLTWGEAVYGDLVDQLPDTSGMVEVEAKVSGPLTRACHPPNPETGAGEWCEVVGEISIQVLPPAEHEFERYVSGNLAAPTEADGGVPDSVTAYVVIRPGMLSFRHGDYDAIPLTTRLYVAFDTPADIGGLRIVRCKVFDYGVLVLTVGVANPTPSFMNFRVFITHEARPEFWTAFVNAVEIV